MNTFSVTTPSSSTQGSVAARVLKTQFGDGYVQRIQDGINVGLTVWSNMFGPASWTILTSIDTFLRANIGQPFIWVPPTPYNDITRYFCCDKWAWVYETGQVMQSITAVFEEVPGV